MQDTYKINSGWGERTDFFRLKKAVLLFKMISLAEQVTRIHVCPGEMRLKSFLSLLCFFSSYENLLFTPPLGVKCIRTCWFLTALSVLHLMGIQELKRVKSGNRDMNDLCCLNRSSSGFLKCVACRKGKWEKYQSPSSLHRFRRRTAVSIKETVAKVYTVQAPQGLDPFNCCKQPRPNSEVPIWSERKDEVCLLCSSVPGCTPCTPLFLWLLAGTDLSHSWDCFKAQAKSLSRHNQFLVCRRPGQHIESRQRVLLFVWVPDTYRNVQVGKMDQLCFPFSSPQFFLVVHGII